MRARVMKSCFLVILLMSFLTEMQIPEVYQYVDVMQYHIVTEWSTRFPREKPAAGGKFSGFLGLGIKFLLRNHRLRQTNQKISACGALPQSPQPNLLQINRNQITRFFSGIAVSYKKLINKKFLQTAGENARGDATIFINFG